MQRRRRALSATALLGAVMLLVAGCAGGERTFDSADELAQAYVDAGGTCAELQQQFKDDSDTGPTVITCGNDTVLTLTDGEDQTSDVATGAMLRGATVLVGSGWVVQDPDAAQLREDLGGSLLALQDGQSPRNVNEGAVSFGDGETRIQVVVDPLCDYCNRFLEANGEQLIELADSGEATVEYRIVARNDSPENGFGSSYGSNALACAADENPDAFRPLLATILADSEGAAWTPESLKTAASGAGASVDTCIDEGQFLYWTMNTTRTVLNEGLPSGDNLGGVPYITIDGEPYAQSVSDADAFAEAVSGE
ncbi:MAG: DsbA family protein [Agrococcus casei]|uniref:DsbA family protein n=1 Tax=Agrococcus casei TaxID=343512 RepID=UPI003F911B7F